jgi:uncharacterized phage protein gp47/JayE
MPNVLDATGLTLATQSELVANYTSLFQSIYGSDINLSSDTPDGQMMNIFIQSVLDLQDLLLQIYNSFDPDLAFGVILDQRCAYNGIQRQAGTYTVTNITLVLSQSVNLYGLDQSVQSVYTVADNAGNRWQLQATQLGVGPGTVVFSFQAANPGATLTIPNTITVPVTVVLGVTSINNPTTYTTLGLNEESDANLKIRRQQSVSLASQGYLAGLLAAVKNVSGVSTAIVYENNTGLTNSDGVPGHSIWVIVAGSATDVNIATAIHQKRNAGCGMYGATSYTITQVDGSAFTVSWDVVSSENIFINFTASSINGVTDPNISGVQSGLVTGFTPGVYAEVNINALATEAQTIDPNMLVTNAGFSTGKLQTLNLSGVPASGSFEIKYNNNASAAINWNDSLSTILSKVQAIPGLSTITASGSLAGQSLVFNLSSLVSVLSLLTIINNTLETSGSAPITFSLNNNYSYLLIPTAKNRQFAVSSLNIIITPMILSPTSSSVNPLATLQLTTLGGYGTMAYSISVNHSGGLINSSGLYTAGSTAGVDTALVTDALGNTATATITVV